MGLAAAAHFFNDAYGNVYPVLIPLMMAPLGMGLVTAALVTTANKLSTSTLQPLAGRLADRGGGRLAVLLPVALAAGAICTGLLPLTRSVWTFLILTVVAGAGSAAFHPPAAAWVRGLSGERKGRSMSLFLVAGTVGRAVAPLALGALALVAGARSVTWLAIPGALLALAYTRVLRGQHLQVHAEAAPALGLVRRRLAGTLALLAMTAARSTLANAIIVLVPIAYRLAGEPIYLGAAVVGVLLLAGSLGNVVGGTISDRIPRERVVVAASILSVAALVGFLTTHGTLSLVFVGLTGFCSMSTNSVTMVLGQELFPESVGMASGIALGLGNAIGTALIALLSVFAGATSVTTALLAAGGVALLAVPAAALHGRIKPA